MNIISITEQGDTTDFLEPPSDNQVRRINPTYAKQAKLPENSPGRRVDNLELLVARPLLRPARELVRKELNPSDSSPWEDRGEEGVYAYIAIPIENIPEIYRPKLRNLVDSTKNHESSRFIMRDLELYAKWKWERAC